MPVAASFEITDDWFNADHVIIRLTDTDKPKIGSHTVTVDGVDYGRMCCLFSNSWGGEWEHLSRGFMSFQFFRKYFIEAYAHHGIGQAYPEKHLRGQAGIVDYRSGHGDYLTVREPRNFGAPLHVCEFLDVDNNDRIAWAIAVQRSGFLDLEELFVRPTYRGKGYARELCLMRTIWQRT